MKATGDVASAHSVRCSERKARAAVDDCATIGVSAESGTARGKVRRIDDLGRVVIPKEIRSTMRIREGGLGCRLGRCLYFVEVSTGHPHPVG